MNHLCIKTRLPIKNALSMQPISVTDSSYVSKKLKTTGIGGRFVRPQSRSASV
jgi:hypothetical protein